MFKNLPLIVFLQWRMPIILQKKLTKIINCNGKMKKQFQIYKPNTLLFHLFKKLLFTMENATAADSSQSNISRIYI